MKWSNKRILITGGAGFIGSNLLKELIELNANIIILDNFSSGLSSNVVGASKVIKGDVCNKNAFNKIHDIDYVFHLGAPSSVVLFIKYPTKSMKETICGFYNVLKWAEDINVKKIVYPSSGSVYGNVKTPQSEDDVLEPNNLYGISKITCEHIARIHFNKIPSVGLRIFAGYGLKEDHKGDYASVVTLFLKSILENKRPIVYGNGLQSRDFIYIDDIVEAFIKAVEKNISSVINVGTGRACTFNQVIQMVNSLLNKNVKPLYIDKPSNYLNKTEADIKKMKNELGLNPKDLEDGLKEYITAYTRERNL